MYVRGKGNEQLDGWLPSYFGGDYPADTWTDIMKRDMEGVDVEEFPPPANVDGEAPDEGHQPTLPPKPTKKPTPTNTPSRPTPTKTPTETVHDPECRPGDPDADAADGDADHHAPTDTSTRDRPATSSPARRRRRPRARRPRRAAADPASSMAWWDRMRW